MTRISASPAGVQPGPTQSTQGGGDSSAFAALRNITRRPAVTPARVPRGMAMPSTAVNAQIAAAHATSGHRPGSMTDKTGVEKPGLLATALKQIDSPGAKMTGGLAGLAFMTAQQMKALPAGPGLTGAAVKVASVVAPLLLARASVYASQEGFSQGGEAIQTMKATLNAMPAVEGNGRVDQFSPFASHFE